MLMSTTMRILQFWEVQAWSFRMLCRTTIQTRPTTMKMRNQLNMKVVRGSHVVEAR